MLLVVNNLSFFAVFFNILYNAGSMLQNQLICTCIVNIESVNPWSQCARPNTRIILEWRVTPIQ